MYQYGKMSSCNHLSAAMRAAVSFCTGERAGCEVVVVVDNRGCPVSKPVASSSALEAARILDGMLHKAGRSRFSARVYSFFEGVQDFTCMDMNPAVQRVLGMDTFWMQPGDFAVAV